jgi:hypothetical protein
MSSDDFFSDIAEKPTEFAPSTFAERGVAVDFTTPLLVQARVRPGRKGSLDIVLPNLAGGRGSYILDWRALLNFMPVSLHDHSLHEAVLKLDRIDPTTVRTAVLTVAAQGLAGREAKQQARTLLDEDEQSALLTNFLPVAELLKRAGLSVRDLAGGEGEAGLNEVRMRHALNRVAGMLGISTEVLYQRVEALARLIVPVGLPWAPAPGRLRRLLTDLDRFAESVSKWRAQDQSGVGEVADLAAAVARYTANLARVTLNDADTRSRDMLRAVREWESEGRVIGECLSRLAWLLDGWAYMVTLWGSMATEPHERQRDAMLEISRLIPVMPKEITEREVHLSGLDQQMRAVQRKWVKTNQDWRTGRMMRSAMTRNEVLKGAMR